MWVTTFNGQFSRYDSQRLQVAVDAGAPTNPSSLPGSRAQVNQSANWQPEQIMVQVAPNSAGPIVVGKDASLRADGSAGGFVIPVGASLILPDNKINAWKAICAAGVCYLIVTYVGVPR